MPENLKLDVVCYWTLVKKIYMLDWVFEKSTISDLRG